MHAVFHSHCVCVTCVTVHDGCPYARAYCVLCEPPVYVFRAVNVVCVLRVMLIHDAPFPPHTYSVGWSL